MRSSLPLSRLQLFTSFSALLTGSALARVLSALALVLIARQVGPVEFGQFAGSLALVKVASVLFSLGLEGWLLRNGYREASAANLAIRSTSVLAIVAALGLLWLTGIAMLAGFLNHDAFPYAVVLLCAVSVWIEEIANTVWTTFKAALRNQANLILLSGTQLLLLTITLVLMASGVQTLTPFLVGRVAGMAVAAVVALTLQQKTFGFRWVRASTRSTLRESVPFAFSMLLALVYERADVTIASYWLGGEQAGYYAPASTLIIAMFLIPATLFNVMLPVLSRVHAERRERLPKLIGRLLLASAGLAIVLGGAVAVSAHTIVALIYGPAYRPSGDVLAILSAVLAIRCITFSLAAVVVAVGWQKWRLIPQALAAVLNVTLNLLIVGQYGIIGIAQVYVVTELVLMIGYLILVVLWQRRPQAQTALSHA